MNRDDERKHKYVFGPVYMDMTRTSQSTNGYLASFGCNRGRLHFQPPGECKDYMWSKHGNMTDTDYPDILRSKAITRDTIR
jgi:hypothetical protein